MKADSEKAVTRLMESGGNLANVVSMQLLRPDVPEAVKKALRHALIEWDATVIAVPTSLVK